MVRPALSVPVTAMVKLPAVVVTAGEDTVPAMGPEWASVTVADTELVAPTANCAAASPSRSPSGRPGRRGGPVDDHARARCAASPRRRRTTACRRRRRVERHRARRQLWTTPEVASSQVNDTVGATRYAARRRRRGRRHRRRDGRGAGVPLDRHAFARRAAGAGRRARQDDGAVGRDRDVGPQPSDDRTRPVGIDDRPRHADVGAGAARYSAPPA